MGMFGGPFVLQDPIKRVTKAIYTVAGLQLAILLSLWAVAWWFWPFSG